MTSSSSSSSSRSWKYDVFLSFRGEDTRKTFVDHLYYALQQHGILTYKDHVTLDRGDTIGPSLLKAIETSRILVIIFSENYADSSWCLDELSHIMKCRDSETGQTVLPVFYHVEPSDVRNQKRKYGEAFAKHKLSENNKKKVESWKKALFDASKIAGWESKHVANGHEAICIQEIVDSILGKMSSLNPVVEDENLVGMEYRLEQLKSQLRIGLGGVRMVGIWGLGGGGKTTLATSFYKKFSPNFDGCCFLGNIREETGRHGLQSLQEKILSTVFGKQMQVESVELGKDKVKQMLCHRKVLIVLDDVDHLDQLKALAGCHKWFGDGSRIIITTRDQHLLTFVDETEVSPISLLSHEEAARLFNKRAYNVKNPIQDYGVLSQEVVTYAAGLPLALIVLGSFLYDKDKDEWLSTLDRLKEHPEMDIVEKLKISYDGLKDVEKELFLDIACFFRTERKDKAMKILDACGFHPAIGVKVLIQKALITISGNLWFDMHDLVQEMAHYIVKGGQPKNPETYSRVWEKQDIKDLCSSNEMMENDKIEAISCHVRRSSFNNFIVVVSNTKKLRYLEVKVDFHDHYPASPFPESFQPRKLVVFKMFGSFQKELWKGYKYLPCLKEMELSKMKTLVRTPDFGGLPSLEKLIVKKCESLEEIHQSLGNHSSLVHLFVSTCKNLTRFPKIVKMEKLKFLKISYCNALTEFPDIEANMDSLVVLTLDEVGIEIIPSSAREHCTNFISLKLASGSELKSIEGNFHALKSLEKLRSQLPGLRINIQQLIFSRCLRKLNLCSCYLKDGEIPKEVGELSSLQELDLRSNHFTRLDFSLSRLTRLKCLELSFCDYLVELPELPSILAILEADCCPSLDTIVRDDININCQWLCQVSTVQGRKNKIGGQRLIETMLQGNSVESGCASLRLNGIEIPRVFETHLVRGKKCRMQLPENWYSDFTGFLFCTASDSSCSPTISMKHEKLEGGSTRMKDSQDDVYLEETDIDEYRSKWSCTWVGSISFGSLRNTLWFNQISNSIEIEFESYAIFSGCGFKLIPKKK